MKQQLNLLTSPIITVKEARKILGQTGKSLTDEEILRTVHDMSTLADAILKWTSQLPEGKLKQLLEENEASQ